MPYLHQTAFAFALSAFISRSSSATNIGFYNFIVGLVTQASFYNPFQFWVKSQGNQYTCSLMLFHIVQIVTAFGFPYSEMFSKTYRVIWSFYPPNLFAKAVQLLTDATGTDQDPGLSWSRRTKCSPNDDACILTMVCNILCILKVYY